MLIQQLIDLKLDAAININASAAQLRGVATALIHDNLYTREQAAQVIYTIMIDLLNQSNAIVTDIDKAIQKN